ncbi:hypothetical protein [Aeromicrobium fastidiosum]|uniref:Uncharacterized protein n=1 Tax=Aeromicrobium fastidiosum TaxID=52699 RepID=A0A641AQU4_9ACTN|nr:hypothetical protein [Aeromicrobium fastidiosum]KAA1378767.1 hypothetical protein ESP62_010580 [Aeromicrobium fastidiosum]MBP2392240.1 hypothetical protein [Aeromicrobium fastidiosum]
MPDINWCRDVDYGSLPQYIAIAVAAVAAFFSVRGYGLSQKSFREDVRTREYSQARLVYAELMEVRAINNVGSTSVFSIEGKPKIFQSSRDGVDPVIVHPQLGGSQGFTANVPVWVYRTRTVNNSEELISKVVTRVVCDGVVIDSLSRGGRLVGPRTSPETFFIVAKDDGNHDPDVEVRFTDSTGVRWSRSGGDPVEKTTRI